MKQALAHPFFDSIRDPALERECPSPMNWQQLKEEKFKPLEQLTLEPYERDHAVVTGEYRPNAN